MDRIRVGLTGLGVVFLITLGAAVAFRPAVDPAAAPETKVGEPLAQLGVAPGAEKNEQAILPAQPPTPAAPVPPPLNAPTLNAPVNGGTLPMPGSPAAATVTAAVANPTVSV